VKKKLIEVALPLDAINAASRKEKSIFFGHPSALHLWWARRPLAACRAVLLAQLLDDPSAHPDRFPTEAEQHRERDERPVGKQVGQHPPEQPPARVLAVRGSVAHSRESSSSSICRRYIPA